MTTAMYPSVYRIDEKRELKTTRKGIIIVFIPALFFGSVSYTSRENYGATSEYDWIIYFGLSALFAGLLSYGLINSARKSIKNFTVELLSDEHFIITKEDKSQEQIEKRKVKKLDCGSNGIRVYLKDGDKIFLTNNLQNFDVLLTYFNTMNQGLSKGPSTLKATT